MSGLSLGDCCLYQIVEWVRETVDLLLQDTASTSDSAVIEDSKLSDDSQLCRLWIVSHHIYNTIKRKALVNNAYDLDITGFSVPGKPGFIVAEGAIEATDEYWRLIRAMSWQKITLREREIFAGNASQAMQWRKFSDFKENVCSKAELVDCLTQLGLSNMLNVLFGMDFKD